MFHKVALFNWTFPDNADFIQLTTNVTFTSAAMTDSILFMIIDDSIAEPPEDFFISVGPVTTTITIMDDDGES